MDNAKLQEQANEVITKLQPLFERIQEISRDLQENTNMQDIDRYFSHEDVLTGIYGQINIEYKKIRAIKKNQEVQYYNQLKLESDLNHTKFISAATEKEASAYVSPLREARDIIEGYVEVVVKSIETCRSHIYEARNDKKYDV